jgi:hypothetical protein
MFPVKPNAGVAGWVPAPADDEISINTDRRIEIVHFAPDLRSTLGTDREPLSAVERPYR